MGGKTSTYDSELAGQRSPPFQKTVFTLNLKMVLFSVVHDIAHTMGNEEYQLRNNQQNEKSSRGKEK